MEPQKTDETPAQPTDALVEPVTTAQSSHQPQKKNAFLGIGIALIVIAVLGPIAGSFIPLFGLVISVLSIFPFIAGIIMIIIGLSAPGGPKISNLDDNAGKEQHKSTSTAYIKAVIGGLLLYIVLIILSYITFGAILIPIKNWKSYSEPIPLVNTVHFMVISVLCALYILHRNKKSGN